MTYHRPPAWNARRRRPRRNRATPGKHPEARAETGPEARLERARDGGKPEAPVMVPTPRALRNNEATRRGPYEDAYEISHGYDAERTID